MKKIFLIILISIIVFVSGCELENEETKVLFDANQYSYISKDELIQKLGEPNLIDSDVYSYDEMEFTVLKDTVTKFKYLPDNSIKFNSKNDIFKMFGVSPNEKTIKTVTDNGVTYKYQNVSDTVFEFEVYGVNEKEKTFDMVFISYQQYTY